MDIRSAPLVLPALTFVCGAALAFHLDPLPIPLLALLAALALCLRRRQATWLGWLAVGVLWTAVAEDLPASRRPGWDPGRPVAVAARPVGPWRRTEWGWTAPARTWRISQGRRVARLGLDLYLQVPGEEEPPPLGTPLYLKGYLKRPPGFANAQPVAPGSWRLNLKSRRFLTVIGPPGAMARASAQIRRCLEAAFARAGDDRSGTALARALVLGDPSRLTPELTRGLRRSGLGHLLALSGLHVGLLAALVVLPSGRLPRRLRLTLVLAAVALYLLAAGPRPSLLRAALMVGVGVAALALERPPSPANALALAVLMLVAHRPRLVGEIGFQLTVSATAGILRMAPLLARRWSRRADGHPAALTTALATTVAAQLATLPWALPRFHGVSPLAPLLNLVAVPWTALALMASLLWTAAAMVAPAGAAACTPLLDAVAAPFAWPSAAPASPWWFLPLDLSAPASAALAGALALSLLAPPRRLRVWLPVALALGLAAAGPPMMELARGRDRGPQLALLDVGQGDAILLRDGPRALLVDGGGWRGSGGLGGRVLLPALVAEGVRRLEAVVMTHPDIDHCGGLVEVGSFLPIAEVWTAPGWEGEPCAEALRRLPGARARTLSAGGRGRLGRWHWLVLHPPVDRAAGRNARSLVILAEVGRRRVLLTGDLDAAAERWLAMRLSASLAARVLKVAHHGSAGSSSDRFLSAVRPRLALISAGRENPYGHPSPMALERLRRRGARTLRTDRDGLVRLTFDPAGITHIDLPASPRSTE